jgi:hypothetical protein
MRGLPAKDGGGGEAAALFVRGVLALVQPARMAQVNVAQVRVRTNA